MNERGASSHLTPAGKKNHLIIFDSFEMVFFCYFEEATPNDVNKLYFCLKLFLKSVEKKNKKNIIFLKILVKK